MKHAVIGLILGILVASAAWFIYLQHLQAKHAVEMCGLFAGEAEFAEKLIAQADDPSEEARRKTRKTAAMMVRSWVLLVDETDRKYPWTDVKAHAEPEYSKAIALANKWVPEKARIDTEGQGSEE